MRPLIAVCSAISSCPEPNTRPVQCRADPVLYLALFPCSDADPVLYLALFPCSDADPVLYLALSPCSGADPFV